MLTVHSQHMLTAAVSLLVAQARLLNMLGYKLPFDRHYWTVDRCGEKVRYVIDFYNAPPQNGAPVALHLDVRPALDSPQARTAQREEAPTPPVIYA